MQAAVLQQAAAGQVGGAGPGGAAAATAPASLPRPHRVSRAGEAGQRATAGSPPQSPQSYRAVAGSGGLHCLLPIHFNVIILRSQLSTSTIVNSSLRRKLYLNPFVTLALVHCWQFPIKMIKILYLYFVSPYIMLCKNEKYVEPGGARQFGRQPSAANYV